MADLTLSASLELDQYAGKIPLLPSVQGLVVAMAGSIVSCHFQTIGTTKENIELGADHATLGWSFFVNCDLTNYVSYGLDADTPFAEMKFGEFGMIRLARTVANVSMKADTGACVVFFMVCED